MFNNGFGRSQNGTYKNRHSNPLPQRINRFEDFMTLLKDKPENPGHLLEVVKRRAVSTD